MGPESLNRLTALPLRLYLSGFNAYNVGMITAAFGVIVSVCAAVCTLALSFPLTYAGLESPYVYRPRAFRTGERLLARDQRTEAGYDHS